MQLLERPAGGDELRGEMIQQFGMRRAFAEQSEVARCSDEAPSEMMLPNSIDQHASGQRIRGIGNRFRQLQTSAPFAERGRFGRAEDRQEASRNLVPQVLVIATDMHLQVRRRVLGETVRDRILCSQSLLELLVFFLHRGQQLFGGVGE